MTTPIKMYATIHMAAPGALITAVSGATGAYDLTLENGEIIVGYDETAGDFSVGVPVIGDLCLFGALGGSQAFTAANANVVPSDGSAEDDQDIYWRPGIN